MARALTSEELELLRSDGQWTKLYLAILQPNTVYTALLNGEPGSTDNVHTITFDGGSGTLTDVQPGMTLYVGTASGAHDLGMCRIRKAPIAGTFYIGLTSEIDWQDNCFLTVVDDFDLWAKHAALDAGVLKMDVDVAYSDQHAAFSPVPVLGPHAVAKLEDATVDVQFGPPDGEESWVPGSTISSYAWVIPDATSIDDDTAVRPIATFDTTGTHVAYCTVTAANGKSTTGVRKAFIWDDENMPGTVFQLAQCFADYETGGWMFDLSTQAEASLDEIRDRSLVVLFAEDWYGTLDDLTKQSIGPIEGRENIVCVGRIVGQSIRWDRETGNVHFTVQGAHHWLNKIDAFPIQIQPATVAGSWSQMPLMTVDRVLHHLLYWHSTVIETMDFYPSNDTRYAPDGMSMASKLWGQLVDIAFSKIMAFPGVDRFGRLFVEVDPQMVPEADRDFPVVMALTDDDWVEGIDLQRVTVQDCSLIRLTSQLVNESGGAQTLYSLSPGHTPRRYGDPEFLDRILAASQAESNSLAGLVLGWRTNEFPDVPVNLGMNNRMIDLWPRQFASLEMETTDNPREVSYDGNLIPRRIALYFDGDIGYMHPELNFEGETFEQLSTNGDIPDVDPDDLQFPPLPSLPPLPELPILIPGTVGDPTEGGPVKVLIHDVNKGLLFSENFNEDGPRFRGVNAGLTEARYQNINMIKIAPSGAVYVAHLRRTGFGTFPFVAYAPYIGGTFTIIEDVTSIAAKLGSTGFQAVNALGINPLNGQVAYVISVGSSAGQTKIYVGSGTSFTEGADLTLSEGAESSLSFGHANWRLTSALGGTGKFIALSADGSSIIRSVDLGGTTRSTHVPISTTDEVFMLVNTGSLLRITQNGAVSGDFSVEIGSDLNNLDRWDNLIDCDPTGTLLMASWDTGQRGKSSDGGAAWSGLSTLTFGGDYAYAWAGGAGVDSRWIAGKGILRYSPDFGDTWEEKADGNLTDIAPIPNITIIKVVQF